MPDISPEQRREIERLVAEHGGELTEEIVLEAARRRIPTSIACLSGTTPKLLASTAILGLTSSATRAYVPSS